MARNVLYYGDNLAVLRQHVKDDTVDLVYLDPPFNSSQDYNVLFAEQDGSRAAAQVRAFEDTWHWDGEVARAFEETIESGGRVADVMRAFRTFLGASDMMAYLTMMAPRLAELRRALKPSGSLYLHCDPTASHYLKLLLDAVFGLQNFRNEIVWRRSHPKGHASTRFARSHDVILFYAKDASRHTWNSPYLPHEPDKVAKQYAQVDEDGRRYQLTSLLNPNPDRPNLTYEYKGVTRVWRWTRERMAAEEAKGRIVVPKDGQGVPRYKRYLDEQEGVPVGDFWNDVEIASGRERLGYPTQKPATLLERIVKASSNADDLVLDPFCGCGTAVDVAHRLGRRWIGIDITYLAISLIRHRLRDAYGPAVEKCYKVVGEPVSLPDARRLAAEDPYQFQWWALSLVRARPVETRKGADKGVDGRLFFHDESTGGRTKQIVFSVKAGHVGVAHVRDLRGVLEREQAEIGVYISLEEPTRAMRTEASSAGFYVSPWGRHPRLQLITVAELLEGHEIDAPPSNVTFKRMPRVEEGRLSLDLFARDGDDSGAFEVV